MIKLDAKAGGAAALGGAGAGATPKSLNAPASSKVRELRGVKFWLGTDGDEAKCVECRAKMGNVDHFK